MMMQRRMLLREDDAALGKDDLEVRRKDRDKINSFTDEDEKAPYVLIKRISENSCLAEQSNWYEIGDTFFALPLLDVQRLLSVSTGEIDQAVSAVENNLSAVRDEMEQLKIQLYARIGKSINLET
ncbi:hypothetical protein MMC29_007881 [Sticta canariensis]|nr:hypothetical protein [Sticta canariensis]